MPLSKSVIAIGRWLPCWAAWLRGSDGSDPQTKRLKTGMFNAAQVLRFAKQTIGPQSSTSCVGKSHRLEYSQMRAVAGKTLAANSWRKSKMQLRRAMAAMASRATVELRIEENQQRTTALLGSQLVGHI